MLKKILLVAVLSSISIYGNYAMADNVVTTKCQNQCKSKYTQEQQNQNCTTTTTPVEQGEEIVGFNKTTTCNNDYTKCMDKCPTY